MVVVEATAPSAAATPVARADRPTLDMSFACTLTLVEAPLC